MSKKGDDFFMNEGMKISQSGRDLIARFEGLRLEAYQDSVGVWTIGYGHTKGVYPGQVITLEQANAFLDDDLATHASGIFKYVTVKLNQNQFDALVSFHFNLGPDILRNSQLLNYINTQQWQNAASEMKKYVYAGGQLLEGLVNRRNAEAELFLKNVEVGSNNKEEIKMYCLFKRGTGMFFYNGVAVKALTNPSQVTILQTIYRDNNGKEMPVYDWSGNNPTADLLIETTK